MSKLSNLTSIALCLLSLTAASNLKAQTLTDPGISQYNYKMPNKAAMAKAQEEGQHFTVAMNSFSKRQSGKLSKYAVQPSSIIIAKNDRREPMNINPLSSVSNYKTQPVPKMQSTPEEYSASLN